MSSRSVTHLRPIRVFIASPGDLATERRAFPTILEKVNRQKAKPMGILLEPLGWEDTLPGIGRPQALINADLKKADLVVMLIWKRWGTPTGEYSSGFEEEYCLARKLGKEIWLYFRSVPDAMLADPGEHLRQVIQFRDKIESERQLLCRRYGKPAAWRDLLEQQLCRWLDGQPLSLSPPTESPEYASQIAALEREIQQLQSSQARVSSSLVQQAWQLADAGHLTLAEKHFADAIELATAPSALNSYAQFLLRVGDLGKASDILLRLVEQAEAAGEKSTLSAALGNLGIIYQTRGDLEAAQAVHRNALAINQELGRKEGMAANYSNLGNIYQTRGDLEAAEEMYRKSLAINQELGSKEGMAVNYGNLGNICQTRGDLEAAEEMHRKSLAINLELGSKEGMAVNYGNLGNVYRIRGDLETAEEMYRKSLAIEEELGSKEGMARGYSNLGNIHQIRGEREAAEEMHRKSLAINLELGRKEGMATDYGNLGNICQIRGDREAAEEMYRKALDLFSALGSTPMVQWVLNRLEDLRRPPDPAS